MNDNKEVESLRIADMLLIHDVIKFECDYYYNSFVFVMFSFLHFWLRCP